MGLGLGLGLGLGVGVRVRVRVMVGVRVGPSRAWLLLACSMERMASSWDVIIPSDEEERRCRVAVAPLGGAGSPLMTEARLTRFLKEDRPLRSNVSTWIRAG